MKIFGSFKDIEKSTTLKIIIPTFEVSVTPSSKTIQRGESTTYTLLLTPSSDFKGEVKFTMSGLPSEEASWDLILKDKKFAVREQTEFTIEITTTNRVQTGTYSLTLTAEGGGIKSQVNISLIIR